MSEMTVVQRPPWDWSAARVRCLREAQRMLRDPSAAEDAVQEALLRAWRQRDSCQRPDAPIGWMVRITRNEALRLIERTQARAEKELPSASDVETARAPSGREPERRLELLDLRRALSCMSTDERALLALRYGCDLSQPEVAEALDVPEGTVKVRLHRARKRVRQAMEAA
jgi:RNA polymerase sigma-70 factor (ECF subfamily)